MHLQLQPGLDAHLQVSVTVSFISRTLYTDKLENLLLRNFFRSGHGPTCPYPRAGPVGWEKETEDPRKITQKYLPVVFNASAEVLVKIELSDDHL